MKYESRFEDFDDACIYADQQEASGMESSMITMFDKHGNAYWNVIVSDPEPQLTVMQAYQRMFERAEKERADRFNAECLEYGKRQAGISAAAAAGYVGRDAEIYADGFAGVPAKITDPRKEGKESIFREGRRYRGTQEGQRLIRVEAVRARRVIEPPPEFCYREGLIVNGEY